MNWRTGESWPEQAVRMFIVPITLFSCASRGDAETEFTVSLVSMTVSICGGADDPRKQAVLVRDLHVLGSLQLDPRLAGVDADDRLDVLEGLERLRQAPAPVRRKASEKDAPGLAHPNHTLFRLPSMSWRFSWMRARTSWATVWTSALSCAASFPPSSAISIGSRKRILNLAGR